MRNKQPFFSVIITSYNCLEFLKRSIQSVLNQSLDNYELIIVDNSSSDGTVKYINDLEHSLRFYSINNGGIISISRNKGVQEAKGKWICFLDADDYWVEEKLFKVKTYIEKYPKYDCFMHDEYLIDNDKTIKKLNLLPKGQDLFRSLLVNGNCFSTSAVTIKKSVFMKLGGFSENKNFTTAEDYELWLRFSKAYKVYFIREVLGNYYLHSNNSSIGNKSFHLNSIMNVIQSNLQNFDDTEKKNIIFRSLVLSNYFQKKGAYLLSKNQIFLSLVQSLLSFALNPLNLRSYKNFTQLFLVMLGIIKL